MQAENFIQIMSPMGEIKTLQLFKFSALDGWNIQSRFKEFAASHDAEVRKKYLFDVLSYARVIIQDRELTLSTSALVDNHLGSYDNIKLVFEAILRLNEIDPDTHAKIPTYWEKAGEEMSVSFIAEIWQKDATAMLRKLQRKAIEQLAAKS